jgi:hypothetical protein
VLTHRLRRERGGEGTVTEYSDQYVGDGWMSGAEIGVFRGLRSGE